MPACRYRWSSSGPAGGVGGGAEEWEIYSLHVAPLRKGAGLGSQLFDAAATLGRKRGGRELVLWVVETNAGARSFYERKGMRPEGVPEVHPIAPGETLVEVLYRTRLNDDPMNEQESAPRIRAEIQAYYALGLEASRLDEGYFPLEEARTRELILRHLPNRPLRILDVGGAAGRYALWLAELGHEVHLVDPIPLHVDQARTASAGSARPLASVQQGDARDLSWEEASVDAVLLLGPLYHLGDRGDRVAALRESRRVLRPGGYVFAAVISRFASLLDWLTRGSLLGDSDLRRIALADVHTGHHQNDTGRPEIFTTAYFHRPEEVGEEVIEAGLEFLELAAIEGPGAFVPGFAAAWRDSDLREGILGALRLMDREPSLLGASPHLLAIGRRDTEPE